MKPAQASCAACATRFGRVLVFLLMPSLAETLQPLVEGVWSETTATLPGLNGTAVPTRVFETTLVMDAATFSPYSTAGSEYLRTFCSLWQAGGWVGPQPDACPLNGLSDVTTRVFNGSSPGPLLRMRRCETYRITVQNNLEPDRQFRNHAPEILAAGKPNTTNLHTHGLHVSGQDGGDFVLRVSEPQSSTTYLYRIPCDHMGGTMWYHPHGQHSSGLQTGGGAFGMLIVDDDAVDGVAPIASLADTEVQLVLHRFDPRTIQQIARPAGDTLFHSNTIRPVYLVNGEALPVISLPRDEWTRFRVLHVSVATWAVIYIGDDSGSFVASCEMQLLAKDGVYLGSMPRQVTGMQLNEASRADVVVMCGASAPTRVHLWANHTTLTQGVDDTRVAQLGPTENRLEIIAHIDLTSTASATPVTTIPPMQACFPWYLADLREANVQPYTPGTGPVTVWLGAASLGGYRLHNYSNADRYSRPTNGFIQTEEQFLTHLAISRDFRANQIYEFNVVKNAPHHPFHTHVNHYQLTDSPVTNDPLTPNYHQPGDWFDTWSLLGPAATVRTKFALFGGPVIVHCHVIVHETKGAMAPWFVHGGINFDAFPIAQTPQACAGTRYDNVTLTGTDPNAPKDCYCDAGCESVGDCCSNCSAFSNRPSKICGTTTFTFDEVSQHHLAEDLWMAIDGNVYNFTDFIHVHPGGWQPYIPLAGHDASNHFHSVEHHTNLSIIDFVPCLGTVTGSDPALLYNPLVTPTDPTVGKPDPIIEGNQLHSGFPAVDEDPILITEQWDYIIVGAGSSGSALAWMLSEDPSNKVLMIEEGPWVSYRSETHSDGYGQHFWAERWFEQVNKGHHVRRPYHTQPILGFNNRSHWAPRAKGTGGCSLHNAHVFMHPNSNDFDLWASEYGNPEWNWRNIAPYGRAVHSVYKATENNDFSTYPYLDELYSACEEAGFEHVLHPNPTWQKGCNLRRHIDIRTWDWLAQPYGNESYSPDAPRVDQDLGVQTRNSTPWSTYEYDKDGSNLMSWWLRRQTAFDVFVAPVLNKRPNLEVATRLRAERIIFSNDGSAGDPIATGVEVRQLDGTTRRFNVTAAKEVILSAGVYNSPQLLMLSGVGPRAHLEELNIPVVHDLPGVGTGLTNDGFMEIEGAPLLPGLINSTVRTVNGKLEWTFSESANKWATQGVQTWGPVGNNSESPRWNTNIYVRPSFSQPGVVPVVVAGIEALASSCRGTVRLQSRNPAAAPLINTNALCDDNNRDDIDKWLSAMLTARRLWETPSLVNLTGTAADYLSIPKAMWDNATLLAYVRQHGTWTNGHPQGTCPMGPRTSRGGMTVVDSHLRVHGIQNLRVVDASIFPVGVKGNTNQPAVVVGLHAGSLILLDNNGVAGAVQRGCDDDGGSGVTKVPWWALLVEAILFLLLLVVVVVVLLRQSRRQTAPVVPPPEEIPMENLEISTV